MEVQRPDRRQYAVQCADEYPGFAKLDFSALKVVVGGGAAVQESVAKRWQEVTGTHLTEAYGLTETSPGVCCTPLGDALERHHWPAGHVDRSEHPRRDFRSCRCGMAKGDIAQHTGEICVRGPQVMRGYWNNWRRRRRSSRTAG
jgi:long-chain acyl-CoA synthetase